MTRRDVIDEVLSLLAPMLEPDGGSLRIAEYSEEESRLVVDYLRGSSEACSMCVLDGESLGAFIEEGLQTRGVDLADVSVHEAGRD